MKTATSCGMGYQPVYRTHGLVARATLIVVASCALAGDWPQWGGTNSRNMVSAEKNLPVTFEPGKPKEGTDEIDLATTKNVKWVAKLGSQTYGNPTVANGRIVLGTNNDPPKDARYQGDHGIV